MSLYPSLEDMKVDKLQQAQFNAYNEQTTKQTPTAPAYAMNPYPELNQMGQPQQQNTSVTNQFNPQAYPSLLDYMGLELTPEEIALNMPEYGRVMNTAPNSVVISGQNTMVAPLSGASPGFVRGQVTNGIRELILCKGTDKKVGLRARAINKGVFISLVVKDSPAALAGLRFGDQILQINGTLVAGLSADDVHKILKKSDANNISLIVRDRPFERSITLHKDSTGSTGFQFSNGKITAIVKDSSAARNGLIIDQQILEVNGQNVIGMKDKEISSIITNGGQIVTLTIIPTIIYDHIMKNLSTSFIRGIMDHSIPDF
uniref:Putative frizzled binding protein n=1 Tax=Corethrella appendiculata TaxID=1370023 RepID=U5EZT1_9DIPT